MGLRPGARFARGWSSAITLNISWRQHPTKLQFYGPIPDISTILRERRMRFAGHYWRARERSTALVT